MAQTAPLLSPADAPRPLPRRTSGTPKAVRPPRLVPLDGLWLAALALASASVSVLAARPQESTAGLIGAGLAALTVALLYLLGWRARDRAAGVVAGLLLATSLPFAQHAAASPRDALLALLSVASLLSFVAGSSLLALALAGLAAVARPDALLLGVVILVLALAQRRRFAPVGAALFLGLAGLGWAALIYFGHRPFPVPHTEARGGLAAWAVAPGMAFVTWLLLPFCAELGEAPRRARWLPVVLWTVVYFVASCGVRLGGFGATLFPLLPLWFALAGGGLSRLLPALTGEVPLPWARYLLATAAVLSLLGMRFAAERPLLHPAPTAVTLPVSVAPAVPPVAHPVILPVPVPAIHQTAPPVIPHPTPPPVPKPTPEAVPKPIATRPDIPNPTIAKPKATVVKNVTPRSKVRVVPLYIRRNGRLVRRSSWAVAWDKRRLGIH